MTDAVLRGLGFAHPDERLEKTRLPLFSYDRLSIILPEKGWILPPKSYLSKPVSVVCVRFHSGVTTVHSSSERARTTPATYNYCTACQYEPMNTTQHGWGCFVTSRVGRA
eukprot:713062-Prymnesium_polylepis.1